MNNSEWSTLVAAEEAKRRACVRPDERWRLMAEALNWAEANSPVPRNSKAGCLAAQWRLLEQLEEWEKGRRCERVKSEKGGNGERQLSSP